MDLKYLMSLEIFLSKYIGKNCDELELPYMEALVDEYKEFMGLK